MTSFYIIINKIKYQITANEENHFLGKKYVHVSVVTLIAVRQEVKSVTNSVVVHVLEQELTIKRDIQCRVFYEAYATTVQYNVGGLL